MFATKKQQNKQDTAGGGSSSIQGHISRFQDLKRDGPSRVKHLKLVLESASDPEERRSFLEQYSFEAFYLFHDLFCQADTSPPSFGRPGGEIEFALWTLEQILCYLPELISQRWQYNAIGASLKKCLHPQNVIQLRKIAIRLFILWYETLSLGPSGAPEELDLIFEVLVPYLPLSGGRSSEKLLQERCEHPRITSKGVYVSESPPYLHRNFPVVSQPSDKEKSASTTALTISQSSGLLQVYLDKVFDSVVKETQKIAWPLMTREENQRKCLHFLIQRIRKYYVSICFPNLSGNGVDVYKPSVTLPEPTDPLTLSPLSPTDPMVLCRYCVIRWISAYAFSHRTLNDSLSQSAAKLSLSPNVETPEKVPKPTAKFPPMYDLVRSVIFGSREDVNCTLSLLKEGLLLPMECYGVMGRIFRTLREWIFMEDLPVFMEEPCLDQRGRTDGKEPLKAGVQASLQTVVNILCWFYYSPYLLEEKRSVAFQISHKILGLLKDLASPQRAPTVNLAADTWLVLLRCLLRIMAHTVKPAPPQGETQFFAKGVVTSLFQTVLITWVLAAAVCRVPISSELWNELLDSLSERTGWPELIDEWNKVLESVTRALALNFYQVDLQNPPLERLSEQKMKKQMALSKTRLQNLHQDGICTGASSKDTGFSNRLPQAEAYDFCQTVSPGSSLTTASFKGDEKDSMDSARKLISEGSESSGSPVVGGFSSGNKAADQHLSSGEQESHVGSESSQSFSGMMANPEVVSLGSVSIDSNSFGLLSSEREGNEEGHKSGGMFGDRDSMTPSPVHQGTEEEGDGGLDGFDDVDGNGGDVELTPREGHDGGDDIWIIVWKRILGCIGDINEIRDPMIHLKAITAVSHVVDMLLNIEANQGVSLDGQPTSWPQFTPPIQIVEPWLMRCLEMPDRFQNSRVVAFESLCRIFLNQSEVISDEDILVQFFHVVHKAIKMEDEPSIRVVVRSLCPRLLHQKISGWQVLVQDCFVSCRRLILEDKPCNELSQALLFVAGLLCFPYESISVLNSFSGADILEEAVRLLINAVRQAAVLEARQIAVNGLSMFVCCGVTEKLTKVAIWREAWSCLLEVVAGISGLSLHVCDALSALLDSVAYMNEQLKVLALKIVETYCTVLGKAVQVNTTNRDVQLCQRLLCDSTEWCLRFSDKLRPEELNIALNNVFKSVNVCLAMENATNNEPFSCAIACQKLLVQCYHQHPLPEFGISQLGSMEVEGEENDPYDFRNSIISGFTGGMLWSASPLAEPDVEDGFMFIVRDVSGKHCWSAQEREAFNPVGNGLCAVKNWLEDLGKAAEAEENEIRMVCNDKPPEKSDCLSELLQHLATTSPEAIPHTNFPNPSDEPALAQEIEIGAALHQVSLCSTDLSVADEPSDGERKGGKEYDNKLSSWRSMLGDLSLVTWNQKPKMSSVADKDNGRLQRELRHIDKIYSRETHKLAIIYVAEGQEDKQSILSNTSASRMFEEFVGKLGWEIDMATHPGYTGGLPGEGCTPYYATCTTEVIYHVSTRMPAQDLTKKLRHLGNDEVHIVWSEHWRDYRRSIIATEFCDVLIVIYPMSNQLFRIQVETKESSSALGPNSFGPLFNGAVVKWANLASLVRATALNAGRTRRRFVEGWRHWYEQRLETISTATKQVFKDKSFSMLTADLYLKGSGSKTKLLKSSNILESSDAVTV